MDAPIVSLVLVAALPMLDALALAIGRDSRPIGDDDWARSWSSNRAA